MKSMVIVCSFRCKANLCLWEKQFFLIRNVNLNDREVEARIVWYVTRFALLFFSHMIVPNYSYFTDD